MNKTQILLLYDKDKPRDTNKPRVRYILSMSSDTIIEIRKDGEKFLRTLNEELYRNLAGLKRESNLKVVYEAHPAFGDPDVFFSVKDMPPKDKEEEKGLKLLLSFLARSIIESRTAKLKDEILTIETRAEIPLDYKIIPYRGAVAEIKREPKRTKREEIYEKRREIVLKLNPLFLQLFETMHGISSELGFSYTSLCDEIEGLNLSQLEEKARLFLKDTEYVYRDLLKWFLSKRMELKLQDAKRHDLCYLFNSFELKANFPKIDLKALARKCLIEMGIEIGENIKVDLAERKSKASRAFVMPIEVPEKIMLVVHPIGGIEDYESLFHELGIALCYGHREREDKFEFRRLIESASKEVFGFLFQNLLLQPKWLRRYLKLDTGSNLLQFLYLRELMMIRYYSGKLIYELSLHKDEDFKSKSDSYRQILKEATLCDYSEADYLNDVDPFFYTASYLKASTVEAELRLYLREKFDEEWWREKEAGDFIRKMWKERGRITSEEISKRARFEELDIAPLLGFFQEVFG